MSHPLPALLPFSRLGSYLLAQASVSTVTVLTYPSILLWLPWVCPPGPGSSDSTRFLYQHASRAQTPESLERKRNERHIRSIPGNVRSTPKGLHQSLRRTSRPLASLASFSLSRLSHTFIKKTHATIFSTTRQKHLKAKRLNTNVWTFVSLGGPGSCSPCEFFYFVSLKCLEMH